MPWFHLLISLVSSRNQTFLLMTVEEGVEDIQAEGRVVLEAGKKTLRLYLEDD
jgi:hypothetical protein